MASTNSDAHNPKLSYPPTDGSLLFPQLLEYNAQHNPNHPFFVYPGDEGSLELRKISHLEFYRACQRVAHVVRPGRQGQSREVVAIVANCDTILYQALFMGIIYAGLIPFPMSPRNSAPAVANMLRKTNCHRMIVSQHSLGDHASAIRAELSQSEDPYHLQIEEPPHLATVYPYLSSEVLSSPFVPFPNEEQPEKNDIMFYLHSSGSTGFPKPIPITYLTGNHYCLMPLATDHRAIGEDLRVAAGHLPPFHVIGVFVHVFLPAVSLQSVSVYPPTAYHDPTRPPVFANPQNALENAVLTRCKGLLAVPSFLKEWALSPEAVSHLTTFSYVVTGGGPVSKKMGDSLTQAGVKLSMIFGTTECGPFTTCIIPPEDPKNWEWIRPGPNSKIRWAPLGDRAYEMHVLTCETHQVSVENLPDVKGYATSDAFIQHPTIQGLYKIIGRIDDVLVLSSGEKTVPGPIEAAIANSPYVSGVCMFGRGRHQVGVLVEPRSEFTIDVEDEKRVVAFRNMIWSEVEEANRDAPNFSRIFKEMILVTSTDKPMLRSGKGTVRKKATIKLYEPEIDALYQSVDGSATVGTEVQLPSEWTLPRVKDWLMVHATAVNAETPVHAEVDLFEQGFDSLSAAFLRNHIIGSFRASPFESVRDVASRISPNVIFANPTLILLATHLVNLITGTANTIDNKAEIERMIEKYSSGLQGNVLRVPATRNSDEGHVILLTGSTGGLGSYMLASLLKRKDVIRIYALNRLLKTTTTKERQRSTFEDRGLDTSLLHSQRLVHIEGDTSQEQFGLDRRLYEEIRDSVTLIIHNAWQIDFNLSLTTFEPNIRGTRYLINLALASKRATKPRFMFASSIASTQGWDRKRGPVPEAVLSDASIAVGGGYGGSKYVSEKVLANSGLQATSFRIGQITGAAPRGAWPTTEWVAILVKSSITLCAFPDIHGSMAWLPTDAVSGAILDVAFSEDDPPIAVNMVHPRPVEWTALMKPISDALFAKRITKEPLPLIPAAEWYHTLEKHALNVSEEKMKRVPAIKLLGFFCGLAQGNQDLDDGWGDFKNALAFDFSTEVAERASKTVRKLPRLSKLDVDRWVDYWEYVGFFEDLKV